MGVGGGHGDGGGCEQARSGVAAYAFVERGVRGRRYASSPFKLLRGGEQSRLSYRDDDERVGNVTVISTTRHPPLPFGTHRPSQNDIRVAHNFSRTPRRASITERARLVASAAQHRAAGWRSVARRARRFQRPRPNPREAAASTAAMTTTTRTWRATRRARCRGWRGAPPRAASAPAASGGSASSGGHRTQLRRRLQRRRALRRHPRLVRVVGAQCCGIVVGHRRVRSELSSCEHAASMACAATASWW